MEMVDRAAPASSHNPDASANKAARFANLAEAGTLLAERLRNHDMSDGLVLAIANAGVPAGHRVATNLGLPIDIVLIRRLIAPDGPGSLACAVNVAGTTVLDDQIQVPLNPSAPMEHFIVDAMNQFREREKVCRPDLPPLVIANRKVLLIDCAIHTGATMRVALRAVRRLKPSRLIAAVPVASRDGSAIIEGDADEFICLAQPEPFGHSAMWYRNFDRPQDEDVPRLLDLK